MTRMRTAIKEKTPVMPGHERPKGDVRYRAANIDCIFVVIAGLIFFTSSAL